MLRWKESAVCNRPPTFGCAGTSKDKPSFVRQSRISDSAPDFAEATPGEKALTSKVYYAFDLLPL